MAEFEVASYARTSEIEIAIFHAEVIATVCVVFDSERGNLAAVKYAESVRDYFYITSRKVRIFRAALLNLPCNLHNKFASKRVGSLGELPVDLIVENHLSDSITVADVHESHTAHFTGALHPSCQRHGLSGIGEAKFATCPVSIHF